LQKKSIYSLVINHAKLVDDKIFYHSLSADLAPLDLYHK